MIPHDKTRTQIDPRRLVLQNRENELYKLICQTGYIPEIPYFQDFVQSLKSGRPWMLAGTRGSGKTAFAEALATACNLDFCVVAGRDGIRQDEILYSWDREEQREWMRENLRLAKQAHTNGREEFLEKARRQKWQRKFLILGEMGLAYDLAQKSAEKPETFAPSVLMLDESDKFGASIEDALLTTLERGIIYVPRLENGIIGVSDWRFRPVVFTTSNNLRHKLSPPFVSRHLYTCFATATLEKELEILRARCPNASTAQIALSLKLLDAVRGVSGLEDYPSVRESIDLVNAFERDAVEDLDENLLLDYFCYFVKTDDGQGLLRLQLDYLVLCATAYHETIDEWLAARDAAWAKRWNVGSESDSQAFENSFFRVKPDSASEFVPNIRL